MKNVSLSPLRAIRKYCIDCTGGHKKEVRFCACTDCALWTLRFGTSPKAFINGKGRDSERLFEADNFKDDGRFSPQLAISEIES